MIMEDTNTNSFRYNWLVVSASWVLVLGILVGGRYAFQNLLPPYLSSQQPLDPETLTEEYDPEAKEAIFEGQKIVLSPKILSMGKGNVLAAKDSENTQEEKRIEVDLTTQTLYAYEGDNLIHEFKVSTGKWGKTPTGEFDIWIKLKSTRMSGGSEALGTYYNLPNVPHTMYFYNAEIPASRGFGIHGAYWHDNFGTPMSHGCVNLSLKDAETLFYWADPDLGDKTSIKATKDNPGTKIKIYGKAPSK